ncbi:hypothetical protein, conserved, partial [Eimeria acervulina]
FRGRLYRLHFGGLVEHCIIKYVKADPLARSISFVAFERHREGSVSEVLIPLTLLGLIAWYHVELSRATIPVEFVGAEPPPPFFVDVSSLHFTPPYSAICLDTLKVLQYPQISQLPADGTARFSPSINPKEEIAWAYEVGTGLGFLVLHPPSLLFF